ncbi:MAG: hypothetical protein ACREK8_10800 [Gemmatimonadales bacterium]
MTRTAKLVIVGTIVVVLGAVGAWLWMRRGAGGSVRADAGRLVVEWRGSFRGQMELPARLNWCPVTRVGFLEAISGDSGVAVVLYERNTLTAGAHTVLSSELAATAPRPVAAAAMRWVRLGRDTALAGFRATSGTVRVTLVPGKISGILDARMHSVSGTDSLVVRADFRGVPVVTTAVGCGS